MSDINSAMLRAARALHGVPRVQVARQLRISANTIWRVEAGRGTERTRYQLEDYWQRNGVEFAPGGWVRLVKGAELVETASKPSPTDGNTNRLIR